MLARDRAVLGGYTDREEGGLVVVDRKARCLLKDLQDLLSLNDGFRGAFKKDESIVSVLKHGSGSITDERVPDGISKQGVME